MSSPGASLGRDFFFCASGPKEAMGGGPVAGGGAEQADCRRLAQQLHHQAFLLVLELLGARHHFPGDELLGRLPDLPLLVAEILRDEDVPGGAVFDEEAAPADSFLGGYGGHGILAFLSRFNPAASAAGSAIIHPYAQSSCFFF